MTAFITLVSTSGVLNLYMCLYVLINRQKFTNVVNLFVLTTICTTIYCFASAFALLSTTIEQISFWTTIQYIGMPFSPPLAVLFVMKYLGIPITKKKSVSLLIIPTISFIMVATNEFHHFHYRVFELEPNLGAPYTHIEIGTWYMIHGVFTFGCLFFAFLLLLSRWKETSKVYRPQLIALMWGQLVPMLTAFLYLIGLTPPGIDPVPMVLCFTSALYLWSISKSGLFTVMPIAKDAIFQSIKDGVIVLDETYRIIEFNYASKRMFPQLDKTMYGMDFDLVWLSLSGHTFPINLENDMVNQEITLMNGEQSERIYQVRTSHLQQKNFKGHLIIFTDITDLKNLQLKLEHQAYYDELTNVFNRRAFFQQCEHDFTIAKEKGRPFTVILMDIDHFKKVNDTYGHNIGDQVLVHVATVFQTYLDEEVLFARYGGEEFVIALNGQTIAQGEALAKQLGQYLNEQPFNNAEVNINVTVSFGVAERTKDEDETLYQLLNKADNALYSSKGAGRNRVTVYVDTGVEEVFS